MYSAEISLTAVHPVGLVKTMNSALDLKQIEQKGVVNAA
jgi:hypothetical protein